MSLNSSNEEHLSRDYTKDCFVIPKKIHKQALIQKKNKKKTDDANSKIKTKFWYFSSMECSKKNTAAIFLLEKDCWQMQCHCQ